MYLIRTVCVLMLFVFASIGVQGQDLIYRVSIKDAELPRKLKKTAENAKDSMSFISIVENAVIELRTEGYLTSNVDTVIKNGDTLKAILFLGQVYEFDEVEVSPEQTAIVNAAGLKNLKWNNKKVSRSFINEYSETLLTYMENNGYPFARVKLDSSRLDNGRISAKLDLEKNKYVPFDSLNVFGNVGIRRAYLDQYLDINLDDPYSRKKIKNIEKRLGDLPFLEMDSTTFIKFENDRAAVQLYLKKKKASRFDFIIGVQPTNQNGDRQFSITGDFTAEMSNRLGQGEYIFANIQSRPETRVMDLRFKYPYLFDLPLGIDAKGSIFFNEKFRETVGDFGLLYQFDGASALKVSWNNKTSRLIDVDTASILLAKVLPSQLDVSYSGGGLEYSARAVDYLFNPSRGWDISLGGTVGLKKVIRNNTIEELSTDEVDFRLAYDSLKANTFQVEFHLSGAVYIPVSSSGTFKISTIGGLKYNEQKVFENELYRIGGNKLLRGFDEQSILSDIYLVNTAEFRLLLDRNSYLSFPFVDYGITKIRLEGEEVWDSALSIGLGINFATPAGIFNVSFATGKRLDNPFDFGNTKIHFGYVSLF